MPVWPATGSIEFINRNTIAVKFGSNYFEGLPAPEGQSVSVGFRFKRRPYCLLLQNTPLHPITMGPGQRFGSSDVPAERRLADLANSLAQVNGSATSSAMQFFDPGFWKGFSP
jgi:hypothetical protein